MGDKENESASRTVTTVIGLSVGIGIVLCVGGIVFIEPLMRAFGASEAYVSPRKGVAAGLCGGGGARRALFLHSSAEPFPVPVQGAFAGDSRLP